LPYIIDEDIKGVALLEKGRKKRRFGGGD